MSAARTLTWLPESTWKQDLAWFGDFSDRHDSVRGKLVNVIFCRNEHLPMLTPSYLEEIARNIGFESLTICQPTKNITTTLIVENVLSNEWENTQARYTLIIEGYNYKPGRLLPSRS